jgi:hypothetical protein
VKDPGLPRWGGGRRDIDGHLYIVIAFSLFVNEVKMLLDILVRNGPLQFLPQHFLPADLKIFLGDEIKDLNPTLPVGKDDGLLKISQDNLVKVLL